MRFLDVTQPLILSSSEHLNTSALPVRQRRLITGCLLRPWCRICVCKLLWLPACMMKKMLYWFLRGVRWNLLSALRPILYWGAVGRCRSRSSSRYLAKGTGWTRVLCFWCGRNRSTRKKTHADTGTTGRQTGKPWHWAPDLPCRELTVLRHRVPFCGNIYLTCAYLLTLNIIQSRPESCTHKPNSINNAEAL